MTSRSDQVTQILAEEISYWSDMQVDAEGDEKIAIHGAMCQLMMYSGCPETITRERLLADHKASRAESRMSAIVDPELNAVARARASRQVEAITRLGRLINKLDGN